MTDDSMTAIFGNPSRTACAYAVREDFNIITVILSCCHSKKKKLSKKKVIPQFTTKSPASHDVKPRKSRHKVLQVTT